MWTDWSVPESRSTVRKDSQVTYRKRGLKKLKKFYLEKINLKVNIIVIFTHIKGIRHFLLFLRMKDNR